MVFLLPGAWGEWIGKLMPGNAGSPVASAAAFNPMLLDPWVGFGVFTGEVAVVLLAGYLVLRRRDA
jgi:ABC-2 type transport system permease protein